ncbi:MAG: threonyl-tRNA synthetase editing domain-containing protein [Myxococcota bacterium]|nr:threonyl-tRNA synthetase editing domain-containing protein [Myxococcota bacterium]
MRMLTYQAKRFEWAPHAKTLNSVPRIDHGGAVNDCVVVWLHVELPDMDDEARIFRHVLKHIKWIANKRKMRKIVLHSFTHLGGVTAPPAFAVSFIDRLAVRLAGTNYEVHQTPFGYVCAWALDVYGDSLAKVYKQIDATSST